jgi:hypothetical protein
MTTESDKRLTVYSQRHALVREFEARVREKIDQLAPHPTHYRTMTDVILGRNNTWDDHIYTQRKDAELSRAKAEAVHARMDLALAYLQVAELPLEAERASETRRRRHEAGLLKIEYEAESLKTGIEEQRNRRRLMQARTNHALRELGEIEDDSDDIDGLAHTSRNKGVRRFRERMAARRALHAERDREIAAIRRMGLPQEQEDELIRAVEECADELLNEEGGA